MRNGGVLKHCEHLADFSGVPIGRVELAIIIPLLIPDFSAI